MPTIYLIRHGETDWNRRGLYQGTTDVPLNDAGRAQADALGALLREVDFDAGYTSPLRRARATAEAVLRGTGVPLVEVPELRELSYGLWQGRGSEPAGRCNPGLEWRWKQDPWSVCFPGGESLYDVRVRAARAFGRIVDAHPGEAVLVSGHGHLNRVLLIHALGWERDRFWEIEQTNGCCWRIEVPEAGGEVRTAERVDAPAVPAAVEGAAG
ncbi:MAG TPA: histidine phosphatase family protein [Longimicrobiaceae bacterium]|nr:histidine phosphatase family protein [Longimicrobiaceae bacterium]